MLASHRWLTELTGFALEPSRLAERLTAAGLEVEGLAHVGGGLDNVVVAEVRGVRPHPERDKLTLVTVFDGEGERAEVCGAPNVPAPGGRVVLARLGAVLPGGLAIAERKLGGVTSQGMLCAETELDIGVEGEGIMVLEPDQAATPGTPISQALALEDVVYEIGITPNRPDCLGHVGIARDLCVVEGRPFTLPIAPTVARGERAPDNLFPQRSDTFPLAEFWSAAPTEVGEGAGFSPVRVDIRDPDRCPRYGAALVSGVTVKASPFRLRYRLHVLGQRAINNVVDATNLILLGFGHPIHAFDYDRVRGSRIEVRCARPGERMVTLDGESRTLVPDDLLICDGEGPVALAGVMGGENSEIHAGTTRVLIECAYFAPRSVRRTSKRTGLHTDASHRFERGVDPGAVPRVLADAAALIAGLSGGQVVERALDVHPAPHRPVTVSVRLTRARSLLGLLVEPEDARGVLEGLGCVVTDVADGFSVRTPSHRPDLGREVDLIEELARVGGYDRIPTELPTIRRSSEGTPAHVRVVRALRQSAAAAGLTEAVNYAFLSPDDLAAARLPEDAPRIANPMSEDRSVLRTGLLAGLAANLKLAQRHQLQRFAQFEVARVFRSAARQQLPEETYQLGVLVWGERGLWLDGEPQMDFFDLKGFVEAALAPILGRKIATVPDPDLVEAAPYLHPRRNAALQLESHRLGHLGEVHPGVVDALGLTGRPQFAMVDVQALMSAQAAAGPAQARPLPRFPASVRDVAVVVDESVQAGEVATELAAVGGRLVEEVRLFDIYRGKPVPEGHKSLAYHVVYRDPQSTLTDKIVDKAHAKVTRAAEQRFGASVRK